MWNYLAQTTSTSSSVSPVVIIIYLVVVLATLVAGWIVFQKAGKPGWAIIIPIYNAIVLLSIAGKPWWWLLLFLIPLVNLYIAFVVWTDFAKAFGKGMLFGLGLWLLTPIFFMILAFTDAEYVGV